MTKELKKTPLKERLKQLENAPRTTAPDYAWYASHKAVWGLETAANLYLGFDPKTGGDLVHAPLFNDLLKTYEHGLILTDSKTFWSIERLRAGNGWLTDEDMEDENGENATRLSDFILRKIAAGELEPAPTEGLPEGLYFKPVEIVRFFEANFVNTASGALFVALGIDRKKQKGKKRAERISMTALREAFKKYVEDSESKGLIPNREQNQIAMTEALGKRPTKELIKAVRKELAPASWKEKGRRKKN